MNTTKTYKFRQQKHKTNMRFEIDDADDKFHTKQRSALSLYPTLVNSEIKQTLICVTVVNNWVKPETYITHVSC